MYTIINYLDKYVILSEAKDPKKVRCIPAAHLSLSYTSIKVSL